MKKKIYSFFGQVATSKPETLHQWDRSRYQSPAAVIINIELWNITYLSKFWYLSALALPHSFQLQQHFHRFCGDGNIEKCIIQPVSDGLHTCMSVLIWEC